MWVCRTLSLQERSILPLKWVSELNLGPGERQMWFCSAVMGSAREWQLQKPSAQINHWKTQADRSDRPTLHAVSSLPSRSTRFIMPKVSSASLITVQLKTLSFQKQHFQLALCPHFQFMKGLVVSSGENCVQHFQAVNTKSLQILRTRLPLAFALTVR